MSRIWRRADQSQRMRKRNDIGLAPELAGSCDLSQNSIRNESCDSTDGRKEGKSGVSALGDCLRLLSAWRLAWAVRREGRVLFRSRLSALVESRCLCYLLYSQVLEGKASVWRWYNRFLLYRYASARADRDTGRKNK